MKKKLSCLILCILMMLSTVLLCACPAAQTTGEEGEDSEETAASTSRNPMTLTLWIPTDEDTTSEAISQVEAAMNKITQPKFNTAIEFHAIASDKYEDAVNARMSEIEDIQTRTKEEERAKKEAEREARKKGETIATTEETTETTADASEDVSTVVYPAVTSTQMDIFLIRGYDNFKYYTDEALASSLDDDLNGSSKLMKSYIYPTFLEMATAYDSTYAIPNSHPLGEYTYLLINKELCDSYYYDPESFDSFLACEDFIYDVAQNSDVTPVLGAVDTAGIHYWANDGDYSVLATIIPDEQAYTARLNVRNIFGLRGYIDHTIAMKKMEEAGVVGTDPNEKEFGVGVITGTAEDVAEYEEDYYVNVIRRPRATTDDVFEAMFAVSTYTKDVKRSMEIINLINTDTTFRTLLQYGVEGIHWEIDEESPVNDPYINILSDDYQMNLIETGNVFITYPGEGLPISYWDDGVQQNLDSEIDSLIRFDNYIDAENAEYFEELKEVSADIFKRVSAMTAEEFEASVEELKDEVASTDPYIYLTDDEAEGYESLVMKYSAFYGEYIRER